MPVINEQRLKDDLKSRRFSRVYFFYGQEPFLVKTYADRIKNKALGEDISDMNLLELSGNPELSLLSDHIETMPFFSEYKVIMINDFNLEKIAENETEAFLNMLENVPDTTIVVFYLTGCTFSLRSQRMKKLFEDIKKYALVCEFKPLTPKETAGIIYRKIEREGRKISTQNANYLAEITACDLNLASVETTKLCSYVNKGEEITKEIIDKMVEKRLETKVFTLSDAMISGSGQNAFRILNELFEQRVDPIPVLATLSTAYSEYYAAKIAANSGVSAAKTASDLGYTGARAGFFSKKYAQASKMDLDDLRKAMKIIYETDIKLKTTRNSGNLLLEETVLKLMSLN